MMKKYENNEDAAKSYALRLLIHYMGDLVQPFHCENRFSSEYPDGDKGANSFPLKYHYNVDELHALWDMVIYSQHTSIPRPFTTTSWDDFQVQVLTMMDDYAYTVEDPKVYESLDFEAWGEEAYDIAITLYDGVTPDEPVPQAYIDKQLPVANQQLTIGGYRLYYIIDYCFSEGTSETDKVFDAWFKQVFSAITN